MLERDAKDFSVLSGPVMYKVCLGPGLKRVIEGRITGRLCPERRTPEVLRILGKQFPACFHVFQMNTRPMRRWLAGGQHG